MESNESNYLYIGLMGRGWRYGDECSLNKKGSWSLQADGYLYDNGNSSSIGEGAKLRSGSCVGLHLDMDGKKVDFFVNANFIKSCTILSESVCMAVCFGGSNQICALRPGGSVPPSTPLKNVEVLNVSCGDSLRWDASSLGPNCELRKGGAGVTRTSSDSWGIQCGDTWYPV